jgi:hypothetical protein
LLKTPSRSRNPCAEIGIGIEPNKLVPIVNVENLSSPMIHRIDVGVAAHEVTLIVYSKQLGSDAVRYIDGSKAILAEKKTMETELGIEVATDDLARAFTLWAKLDMLPGKSIVLKVPRLTKRHDCSFRRCNNRQCRSEHLRL